MQKLRKICENEKSQPLLTAPSSAITVAVSAFQLRWSLANEVQTSLLYKLPPSRGLINDV